MEMIISKCDWGMDYMGDLETRLHKYAAAGFDGVEFFFPDMDPVKFCDTTKELGLTYIGGIIPPTIDTFRSELDRILKFKPALINCQAGRDYYDFDVGLKLLRECIKIAKNETDIEVVHETHRRNILYSPWATRRYLEAIPDLYLCADFTHFLVVSESDMRSSPDGKPNEFGVMAVAPDPEKEAMMDIAISRTHHLQTRVGEVERPQTADPRSGAGLKWAEHFEYWWDRVIEERLAEGRPFLTVTPEFGPPPYNPINPETGEVFVEHWDSCVWSMQRFRDRWSEKLKASS